MRLDVVIMRIVEVMKMNKSDNFTVLKVVVDNIYPYIFVEDKYPVAISGYMSELWDIVEKALNFRNEFVKVPFKLGKELIANESVDVGLVPVVVTSADVDKFDSSVPVAKVWYELYTKRNGDGATSGSYIETWSTSLWFAFILTILTLSMLLWIMLRIQYVSCYKVNSLSLSGQNKLEHEEQQSSLLESEPTSLWSCFLIVLGTITSQGYNVNTESTSLRIIMLVVLFFGLLMLNAYSAVLVSRLAVDKADILFPTLESIIERKTHTLCIRESSYATRLFKENESDPVLLPMWRSIINQPPCENTTTVDDIANALCEDRTVILETPHIIASIEEQNRCAITRMPGRYVTSYLSLLMRKHLKFKNKINMLLQKLLTTGIIDYTQKRWLAKRFVRKRNISNLKPVTINHIKGVLCVYAIAIFISLSALFLEKLIHWKKQTKTVNLEYLN
ncbi:hypothetical protein V9T40_001867 [Parthenolecanium corni]|uniref:Ionotropic glutamate receptor C-terminal domain-containing protein n=1 Tax=Parthenolecanium corni TaxID=536013 RepID=A0AAN9Y3K6_9HEMI